MKKTLLILLLSAFGFSQTFAQSVECPSVYDTTKLSAKQKQKYQNFTQGAKEFQTNAALEDGGQIIFIPVVVHVVYKNSSENISDAAIYSQIQELNRAFRAQNGSLSSLPSAFQNLVADSRIQFYLACTDPNGNPTNGITRKQTQQPKFFDYNNQVKFDATDGKNAWNTTSYFNIWVCDLDDQYSGYSSFPMDFDNAPNNDGIVIDYAAWGQQRNTVAHETGHYLGLFHIWSKNSAGSSCSDSDDIDDTPNQAGPNSGCPSYPSPSCNNTSDLYPNFMDYSNCRNMFTPGQSARMRYTLFQDIRPNFKKSLVPERIDGPNQLICNSYNIPYRIYVGIQPLSCANFTWSVSSGLLVTGGQGTPNASISVNGAPNNSYESITVTITIPNSGITLQVTKQIVIGGSVLVKIQTDRYPQPSNYIYENAEAEIIPGTVNADYSWYDETNGQPGNFITGGAKLQSWPVPPCSQRRYRLDVNTSCGVLSYRGFVYNDRGCYSRVSYSPNPANESITLKSESIAEDQKEPQSYSYKIFDRNGSIVREGKSISGKEVIIDTKNLSSDNYFLHVIYPKETIKNQIIIQH